LRKTRFYKEQITYALKQGESGKPVGEACRQIGVSEESFYRWKGKYEGMGVAELRRLRQLEDENRKLKLI
jgi:putative transposase